MKKTLLLFLLLPLLAAVSFAQESRQDVSVGVAGIFPPFITGNTVQQTGTYGLGGLVSYRYMLTPRGAVEGNYQYSQNAQKYYTDYDTFRVHERMQEVSAAYVFSFNFKNFNPFLEGGPGVFFFTPLDDASTNFEGAKGSKNIGVVYGGGIAYEISPSFDIRAEYRGLIMKTPNLITGVANNDKVNRYYNVSDPVIGIAYHF